jgi:cell division protein FtsX
MSFIMLVMGMLLWFSSALDPLMTKLMSEKVVTVYMDPTQENFAPTKVVDAIKVQMGSAAKQISMEEISSDVFLDRLEKNYPEMVKEISSLGPDAKKMMPHYVSLRGSVDTTLIESIQKIEGVESVDTSASKYRPIIETFQALKSILKVLSIAALAALFVLLFYTAKLNHTLHRDAMQIIKQLGGTTFQSKLPQFTHQISIGVLSGFVASILCFALAPMMVKQIQSFSPYFKNMEAPSVVFILGFAAMGAVCGFVSTLWVQLKGSTTE